MVSKKQFNDLLEKVEAQDELIKKLSKKVSALETQVTKLSADKETSSHINNILREKLDNAEMYSRRSCLVLEGLPIKRNENIEQIEKSAKETLETNFGFSKLEIESEFDKAHRLGPKIDGNQKVIMRFKSHGFQNRVYASRKNGNDPKYKIRPSLTARREDLLEKSREQLSEFSNFHFAFADNHGNLKVRVKNKVNNRFVLKFNNDIDIANIISIINDFRTGEEGSETEDQYDIENLFPMPTNY